jgi:hypothetical protein
LPSQSPIAIRWSRRSEPGTLDVSVVVPTDTETVRYFVDGHRVAILSRSEGAGGTFATTLSGLPVEARERLVVASAFDANDKLIGTTENMADFTRDVGMSIRQLGRMTFEVSLDGAPAALASLELDVDGAAVIDGTTQKRRSDRAAVEATYEVKDGAARTFVARGYDAAGGLIVTLERHFILR